MTSVEDGVTSIRPRRGPPRESPVTTARSHEGLEIDAASLAAARLDFANTPDDAVDNLRFYDRQQAYVSARPAPPTKPELALLQNAKKKGRRRATRIASARKSSTRDLLQHA